ncbi:MAG: type II toxin-antitoxin system PemK/MazF family toxin [Alphaproteobacteria bacterium]|nr:type II toxin-antitoxin system PemK/MazF family toxin [Alphaproteobacteria bacterium]
MRRGDVVVIADRGAGDYGGKPRPAVVVQSELFEDTGSVVVCLLTTQETGAPLLRIAVEPGAVSGLSSPSYIAIEKITTIRRDRVGQVLGRLTDDELVALTRSLAVFLGFG